MARIPTPFLVATRSRSGSDTTPWCHSLPSRRFATRWGDEVQTAPAAHFGQGITKIGSRRRGLCPDARRPYFRKSGFLLVCLVAHSSKQRLAWGYGYPRGHKISTNRRAGFISRRNARVSSPVFAANKGFACGRAKPSPTFDRRNARAVPWRKRKAPLRALLLVS